VNLTPDGYVIPLGPRSPPPHLHSTRPPAPPPYPLALQLARVPPMLRLATSVGWRASGGAVLGPRWVPAAADGPPCLALDRARRPRNAAPSTPRCHLRPSFVLVTRYSRPECAASPRFRGRASGSVTRPPSSSSAGPSCLRAAARPLTFSTPAPPLCAARAREPSPLWVARASPPRPPPPPPPGRARLGHGGTTRWSPALTGELSSPASTRTASRSASRAGSRTLPC